MKPYALPTSSLESSPESPLWRGDGAVLITGGLGGLGIVTAEALVDMGARCIVLASRSGKVKYDGQGLQERLDALQASGARVVLEQCDTGDEESVVGVLERVRRECGPLRAVVHAAGVLSDGLMRTQDGESMRRVVDPKAMGVWYLHKHTTEAGMHWTRSWCTRLWHR